MGDMTRTRSLAAALMVGLLAFGAAACGSDDSSSDTVAPIDIADGAVYSTTGATGLVLPEGTTVSLTFEGTTLAVSGGCNTMSGGYTIEDGKLDVGEMISTQKACEEPLMALDTAIGAFLAATPTVAITGDQMTLTAGDITLNLKEGAAAADASALEGVTWTVTDTVQGGTTTAITSDPATVTFNAGTAEVFAGCNTGSAGYTVTGDTIEFGPMILTRMACEDAATQLETTVVAVLNGTDPATFAIDGTTLTLTSGDNGLMLTSA
jgi:heat shock protein HslJ